MPFLPETVGRKDLVRDPGAQKKYIAMILVGYCWRERILTYCCSWEVVGILGG